MFKIIIKLRTYLPFLKFAESKVESEKNHFLGDNQNHFFPLCSQTRCVLERERCIRFNHQWTRILQSDIFQWPYDDLLPI